MFLTLFQAGFLAQAQIASAFQVSILLQPCKTHLLNPNTHETTDYNLSTLPIDNAQIQTSNIRELLTKLTNYSPCSHPSTFELLPRMSFHSHEFNYSIFSDETIDQWLHRSTFSLDGAITFLSPDSSVMATSNSCRNQRFSVYQFPRYQIDVNTDNFTSHASIKRSQSTFDMPLPEDGTRYILQYLHQIVLTRLIAGYIELYSHNNRINTVTVSPLYSKLRQAILKLRFLRFSRKTQQNILLKYQNRTFYQYIISQTLTSFGPDGPTSSNLKYLQLIYNSPITIRDTKRDTQHFDLICRLRKNWIFTEKFRFRKITLVLIILSILSTIITNT